MTGTSAHKEFPSIGATLKSLREGKNLGLADIAAKMHLDVRFIAAIEEDHFDLLPDPIYVRGYIRSYSKLVGADADALVKLFEQHGGNFEPEIIPEVRHSSQTSSSDRPVKAFTYLVILALMILLLAWWQNNFIIETSSGPSPEDVADLQQSPAARPVPEMSMQTMSQYQSSYPTDNLQEIAVMPMDSIMNTQVGTDNPATGDVSSDGSPAGGMIEQLPGALPPSDMVQTSVVPLPGTSVATDVPPASQNEMLSAVNMADEQSRNAAIITRSYQTIGPDLIVLRLNADSWIEITDATNTKVFFDLGRAGDIFNVRGTAPFDVLLGFSQAVTVEYNGRPFDAAPWSRSGVARFTLGE